MDAYYRDYHLIEQHIEYAIEALQNIDQLKIVTFASEFYVPYNRL